MPHTQEAGAHAERIAASDYLAQGYHLVARNFRCPRGEIDLILAKGERLLFVEVKGRSGDWGCSAWASSWRGKRLRLRAAMRAFLTQHPEITDRYDEFDQEIVFVTRDRVVARYREP